MLKNYLTIAWRNLTRNQNYAIVNILGLSIGLACFMLIILYVKNELGYDQFHPQSEHTYRMALERKYPGRSREYAIIPAGYSEVVDKEYAEVEKTCRLFFFQGNQVVLKVNDQLYEEDKVMWADTTFFDLFGIPLLKGNVKTVLSKPNSVVLTTSLAKKLFGAENPVGKTLDVPQNPNDFQVTGVCGDVPGNSHLQFNMLVSSSSLGFIQQPNYLNFSAYTYLKLNPNANPQALESKLPDLVKKYATSQVLTQFGVDYEAYQKQGNGYRYFLQRLPDIYLDSNLEAEIKPAGSRQRVSFFMAIAFLILLIACINFMNLATARSARRAREVGIRKTLGSDRKQIAGQFLMEAVVISLVAAVLAYGIDLLVLPKFNELTGKVFLLSDVFNASFILVLLAAAGLAGLLSGIYPAASLSAFKPIDVLRGTVSPLSGAGGKAGLRNSLVVFQFGISVFLIISTILVFKQLEYTQDKALGFEKESLVTLQNAGGMTVQQGETFKNEVRNLPGVEAVSGCNTQPGEAYFGMSFQPQGAEEMTTGSGLIVDDGYVECMKMAVVAGRSFSKEFADSNAILVNESAAREMNLTDPVGKSVVTNDQFLNLPDGSQRTYKIIGVVKDFHFQSLHHIISPLFLVHNERSFRPGVDGLITVRLGAGDVTPTLRQIETLWQDFQPEQPFNYAFLDRQWANLYENEMTTRKVFGLFSLLAIFIACLGLLALAAFTAERRTKEIGIRKVLGATTGGIVALLSKDFLQLVVIALVIASPIAWYVMNEWLQDFHYRIDIEWWVFVLAGFLAIFIAFFTVGFQSIKAALMNPIKSIRME